MRIWLKLILTVLQNETICTQIGSPSEFQWTKTAGGASSSTPSLELLQRQLRLPPIDRGGGPWVCKREFDTAVAAARRVPEAHLEKRREIRETVRRSNCFAWCQLWTERLLPWHKVEECEVFYYFQPSTPVGTAASWLFWGAGGGWYLSRLLRKHGPNPLISQLGCIHHILSGAGAWADGGLWSGYPDHEHASWMWPFSDSDSGPAIRKELGGAQSHDSQFKDIGCKKKDTKNKTSIQTMCFRHTLK